MTDYEDNKVRSFSPLLLIIAIIFHIQIGIQVIEADFASFAFLALLTILLAGLFQSLSIVRSTSLKKVLFVFVIACCSPLSIYLLGTDNPLLFAQSIEYSFIYLLFSGLIIFHPTNVIHNRTSKVVSFPSS